MSILKRLSVTLFSRLDSAVSDIENHDAIIEAAIEEQTKKIANAKIQLLQLNRRKASVVQQLNDANGEQANWQKRALKEAKIDEAKALECIRRRKLAEQQIEKLQKNETEYRKAAEKLSNDIRSSEQELEEVKQKRQLLKARQSSAQVRSDFTPGTGSSLKQVEKAFDRWESRLSETPLELDDALLVDEFEKAYQKEETEHALKQELELLTSESDRAEQVEKSNE